MKQQKFSVMDYAAVVNKHKTNSDKQSHSEVDSNAKRRDPFQSLVDDIRNELAVPNGFTEEEQLQYHDMLNRAVLGFEKERSKILAIIHDMLAKKRANHISPQDYSYQTLAEAVFAQVVGLHELELILKDKNGLEEIQVVGTDIYEVRQGQVRRSVYSFSDIADLERIQQNLVLYNKESLNPRKKWAEVSLNDGSRVTITAFGFTSEPTLTIRFFSQLHIHLQALLDPKYKTLDERLLTVLRCILHSYFNMVVAGSTNSGKTNLIKAMIAEIPDEERLVTIESRFELMLKRDFPKKNVIEYEIDEEDELHSGKQAFKLALRQSPQRICHAEIRDDDANIYVRCCTRGHEGSITTVHANDLNDVPDAITDMCMLDGRGMEPERLRRRITEYVTQIGIEMAIVLGKRKIVRIGEFEYVRGEVRVRDIVRYDYVREQWLFPEMLSNRALNRIKRHDLAGFRALIEMGLVEYD